MKDCKDIELFEDEAIQNIIDYKWNTYGYKFFLGKFLIYSVFLVLYYFDLESLPHDQGTDAEIEPLNMIRVKDAKFFILKGICGIIQFIFMAYEFMQM